MQPVNIDKFKTIKNLINYKIRPLIKVERSTTTLSRARGKARSKPCLTFAKCQCSVNRREICEQGVLTK